MLVSRVENRGDGVSGGGVDALLDGRACDFGARLGLDWRRGGDRIATSAVDLRGAKEPGLAPGPLSRRRRWEAALRADSWAAICPFGMRSGSRVAVWARRVAAADWAWARMALVLISAMRCMSARMSCTRCESTQAMSSRMWSRWLSASWSRSVSAVRNSRTSACSSVVGGRTVVVVISPMVGSLSEECGYSTSKVRMTAKRRTSDGCDQRKVLAVDD